MPRVRVLKRPDCQPVTQDGLAKSDGPSGTVRRWTSFRSFCAPLRAQAALLPCGRASLQRARHAFKPRSKQKKALLTSCALRFTTPLIRLYPNPRELIPRLRKRPSSGKKEASILACIFPPACCRPLGHGQGTREPLCGGSTAQPQRSVSVVLCRTAALCSAPISTVQPATRLFCSATLAALAASTQR